MDFFILNVIYDFMASSYHNYNQIRDVFQIIFRSMEPHCSVLISSYLWLSICQVVAIYILVYIVQNCGRNKSQILNSRIKIKNIYSLSIAKKVGGNSYGTEIISSIKINGLERYNC